MTSIDTQEAKRNLVKKAGVTVFRVDDSKYNPTKPVVPPPSIARVTSQLPSNTPHPEIEARRRDADAAASAAAAAAGNNRSSGGSGGSSNGMTAAEALALAKFNYEKEQDAKKLAGLSNYYTSGQYGTGFDKLLNMIAEQGKVSDAAIQNAYTSALQNVTQGYDVAKGLGDKGYSALNAYLAANPNNPYAGMTASVGTPADALSSYLSAYGVSDLPVQGQIQADQLQAQQGAANYQNLLNTLNAVAQQGAASRSAESEMAQLLFNTGLGQEKAGYTSQAENARAQALAALQQAMYQSRFGVEQDRTNLANQLAQSIAEAGGNAVAPPVVAPPVVAPPQDDAAALAAQIAARQAAESKTRVNPSPSSSVAVQLRNLAAPAQARGLTPQELLDELNARRGR